LLSIILGRFFITIKSQAKATASMSWRRQGKEVSQR